MRSVLAIALAGFLAVSATACTENTGKGAAIGAAAGAAGGYIYDKAKDD